MQERIRYGGVIPFASRVAFPALLGFYKLLNYATVKIKVGGKNLESDLDRVRLARRLLGRDCIIRVDANCAWNLDEALAAAEAFRPYAVSSYEQPMARCKK